MTIPEGPTASYLHRRDDCYQLERRLPGGGDSDPSARRTTSHILGSHRVAMLFNAPFHHLTCSRVARNVAPV
jgi:hypothetical protein